MAGQIETTLTLSSQPNQLDLQTSVEITVTSNATTFEVNLENNKVSVQKDVGKFILTGNETGRCKVEVKATAENGTEKKIEWYINVLVLETTLTVHNPPNTLNLGESATLDIETNGKYTIEFGTLSIARIGTKPNEIVAIGQGATKVIVKSSKINSVDKKFEFDLLVKYSKPVTDKGTPTSIKLINPTTKKTVTITTSNNESVDDIVVSLPSVGGTLVTDESLTNNSKIISTPYIITPATGTANYTGEFRGSPFEVGLGYNLKHESTVWCVAKDKDFKEIVKEKEVSKNNGDLTSSYLYDVGIGTYYVRVKYRAGDFESSYSPSIYLNIGLPNIHGIKTPLKVYKNPNASDYTPPPGIDRFEDWSEGAYFGVVPYSKLVDDYDYRGTFETIKTKFDPNKYDNATNAWKIVSFKKGMQVVHDNKLWYAIQDMNVTSKDQIVTPGTDNSKWMLDERTAIGTPRLLSDMVGIGHGITDNNHNGMSKDKPKIGDLVNKEEGYIKYIHKGKLCYTPVKPVCYEIAWTDLAQRELCHNQRTIRLGKHLFWIRLPEEEEITSLFTRMMDGTYDTKTITDLELDKKFWILDRQTGASRNVIHYTMNDTTPVPNKTTIDPKSRTGAYRYVLEYIHDDNAPYNNVKTMYEGTLPEAENENFIYDKYSDVGYYGVVPTNRLIGMDVLSTRAGFTSGSGQHPDGGYLKFYWHGMIIFIAKKTPRYNINWNNINSHNCQYGWDMGGNGEKYIEINGYNYRLANILGTRSSPYDHSKFSYGGTSNRINVNNVINEGWKYSIWGECIMRIGECYVGYEEKPNVFWYSDYLREICGLQLGDNFTKFKTQDIIVRYDTDGNGTACYCREVGSGNYTVYVGIYGFGEWYCMDTLSFANTNRSWRPVLFADPVH